MLSHLKSVLQNQGNWILNKRRLLAIWISNFQQLSLTCDNFESYPNLSGGTKMTASLLDNVILSHFYLSGGTKLTTIVSKPSWQCYNGEGALLTMLNKKLFLLRGNTWAHNVKHFWWQKQTNSGSHSDEEPTLNLSMMMMTFDKMDRVDEGEQKIKDTDFVPNCKMINWENNWFWRICGRGSGSMLKQCFLRWNFF